MSKGTEWQKLDVELPPDGPAEAIYVKMENQFKLKPGCAFTEREIAAIVAGLSLLDVCPDKLQEASFLAPATNGPELKVSPRWGTE